MIRIEILMLTLILPFIGLAQGTDTFPIDQDSKLVTYQEVVQQNGTSDELYIRGIDWVNSYYKNPFDVCRIRDRVSGVIEVMHRIELNNQDGDVKVNAGTVNYELRIEFKPGRYRYTITNLTLRQTSRFPIERLLNKDDPSYSPLWDNYIQQIDTKVKEIIASLKGGMQPVAVKPEEKW
jgi:DNA-directed RNA polymerase beta' subunit